VEHRLTQLRIRHNQAPKLVKIRIKPVLQLLPLKILQLQEQINNKNLELLLQIPVIPIILLLLLLHRLINNSQLPKKLQTLYPNKIQTRQQLHLPNNNNNKIRLNNSNKISNNKSNNNQ